MKLSKKSLSERDWEENFSNEEKIPFGSLKKNKKKILFFVVLISLVFFIFLGRIFYLQILKGKYFQKLSQKNIIREEEIFAPRGLIYDRNKNVLVENIPCFDLIAVPLDLPWDKVKKEIPEDFFEKLSEILEESKEELKEKFKDLNRFSQEKIIEENLEREKVLKLSTQGGFLPVGRQGASRGEIEISKLSGIKIKQNIKRNYLYGPTLAHILGYTSKSSEQDLAENKEASFNQWIGKEGIEKEYENLLKGKSGKKKIEVDALGKEKKVIEIINSVQGENIFLTIDLNLQKKVFEIFEKYQAKKKKKIKAAAVGINPQNGEILFLTSFPSYDNNLFTKKLREQDFSQLKNDSQKPLFNRAISGLYPSGSIIKPLVGLAALEEKIISPQTIIFDPGQIQIKEWIFPCWKKQGHGNMNLVSAIANSCDVFFYIVGGGFEKVKGLGIEKLSFYLKKFGLGEKTLIDLPNEKEGLVPDEEWKKKTKNEKWYIGDTYHLAIGQGDLLITPLQAVYYTSFLANSENFFQPHLIKEVGQKKTELKFKKVETGKNNIKIIRQGMKAVMETSWVKPVFSDLSVEVAGKTGTAQFGNEDKTHAWFICFAPYENPKIAIAVLVEEEGEGSVEAMPIVKEILKEISF